MINVLVQVGACLTASLAAWYWYKSARVPTPSSFDIIVPGTYGHTMAISKDLNDLAKALKHQSKLSGKAAMYAGFSAVLSALGVVLT